MKIVVSLMLLLASTSGMATELILKGSVNTSYHFQISRESSLHGNVYRIETWYSGQAEPVPGTGKITKPYVKEGRFIFMYSPFYHLDSSGRYCRVQEAACGIDYYNEGAIKQAYSETFQN